MMTKKTLIALADRIRLFNRITSRPEMADESLRESHINMLANFCASQNPRFNRERWLGYIAGTNGKNGGRVK